jgi:hypothetical protein
VKPDLAGRVLARVMAWSPDQVAVFGAQLMALATLKYDTYDGYRPGVKFLESLGEWLDQFTLEERRIAMDFVLRDLVFVSQAELDHAIETAYPDAIRPMLLRRVADDRGSSRFAVAELARSLEFSELQRKLLILGLSDGARLDRLRRASPGLSHEQFWLVVDMPEETIRSVGRKLREALEELELPHEDPTFQHIVLVEDFSGSGFSLLRRGDDGSWDGKLQRAAGHIENMKSQGVVHENATISVLLYIASETAHVKLVERIEAAGLPWRIDVIQLIPESVVIRDPDVVELCEAYFDEKLMNKHNSFQPVPLGFGDVALPLVLHHNTPNNSVCILWGDTTDEADSDQRRALFPRYERHHPARP